MRFRLCTLLIAAALAPPGLAGALWLAKMPSGLLKYSFLLTFGVVFLSVLALLLDTFERYRTRR